jgi:hypothetical protein
MTTVTLEDGKTVSAWAYWYGRNDLGKPENPVIPIPNGDWRKFMEGRRIPSAPFRAAIITASDRSFAGERPDESGPLIREMLGREGYQVVSYTVLPDNRQDLAEKMRTICDQGEADLILTTGGTGV